MVRGRNLDPPPNARHRSHETVALAGQGLHILAMRLCLPERLAESRHVETEAPFVHGHVLPHAREKRALRDELAVILDKGAENVEGAGAYDQRLTVFQQNPG